jgi:DNA-binding CsgD family transcriptional regulator
MPYAPVVEALGAHFDPGADGDAHLGLAVRRALERAGADRPVMLVVEDVHWADRSTRDLLVYLATTAPAIPLAIVVTYRTEDLESAPPLRRFRADLQRRPNVVHVELAPLDRTEVTALLGARLGHTPPPELAEAVFRRSDGNPLFVEELAATVGADDELPPLVRDVLSSRIEQLSEPTRGVLRIAAVGGRRVDHDRLAAVSQLDVEPLADALREARAANVLTADPERDRYEFRHALLHEAVYADVLPGERRLYHARYAAHINAGCVDGCPTLDDWAELARHRRGAGELSGALAALIEAGLAAEAVHETIEARRHFDSALELWDGLGSDPPDVPLDHEQLTARAAEAASRAGAFERAVSLTTTALERVDPRSDPTAAGLLHERRAWFHWRARDETAALADYETAVGLVPDERASPARARVLAAYADALERSGRPDDAGRVAADAVALAIAAGSAMDEGHARHVLGLALAAQGRIDDGVAELHRARQLAERNGDVADVAGTYVHLWRVLTEQGRAGEMVRLADDAAQFCRSAGMDVAAVLLSCVSAAFLHELGQWDEADERLGRDDDVVSGVPATLWNLVSGLVAVDRGDLVVAARYLATTRYLSTQLYDGRINGLLYRGLAEAALWAGEPEDALTAATTGLELTGADEMRARLAALAVRAEADRAERRRAAGRPAATGSSTLPAVLATLERLDERARARHAPDSSEVRAATATVLAERSRLDGVPDPDRWAGAAARWDGLSFPAPAAYCRWREAEALLASGRRADAAASFRAVHATAVALGAGGLRRAVEATAARAAIALGDDADAEPAPYGLTDRELEVLALVAAGRTNRQIGEALFISDKTASVHVSHILAKLGATSRAQAAAVASQLGLA